MSVVGTVAEPGETAANWSGRALAGAAGYLARCDFPAASGGPVDLAVSGGPDSVALMILARASGLEGRVVHVDHGMRAGSDADGPVVAWYAAALGFACEVRRVSIPPGPDLEARARRARYSVLPPGVLTGHTMDDQAETVLLNVLRGAGLDGLAGMGAGAAPAPGGRRSRPSVRRPLLALRRSETVELCRGCGIVPLSDPTNSDPRFRRNRIRLELLPLLCDIAGRDVAPVLARQAELIGADVDLLEGLAAGIDPLDVQALRAAPLPLARRALRTWLRSSAAGGGAESHPPSAAELARVMEVVRGDRQACQLAGGRRVSRRSGRLAVSAGTGARS